MSQLGAMRYAVLDAAEEENATELWGHRGKLLDSFRTEDSAKALALHRMAYGSAGVVVIDGITGSQVFPPPRRTTTRY